MTDTLSSEAEFTLLAPSDEAFEQLPAEELDSLLNAPQELEKVLLYHVIPGSLAADEIVDLNTAQTALDQPLEVTAGDAETLLIGGAHLTTVDIEADNGMIHIIDTVLLPSADE